MLREEEGAVKSSEEGEAEEGGSSSVYYCCCYLLRGDHLRGCWRLQRTLCLAAEPSKSCGSSGCALR